MQESERFQLENALTDQVIAVFGRKEEMSFEEVTRQYRQIEADFIARAGDDDVFVLDTKRTIANHLLMDAEREEQSFDICRTIWEDLVRLEFWNIQIRHVLSRTYARCCQWNGEFDAGLAVIEPLIEELEVLLAQSALTPNNRAFCEQFLEMHTSLRADLLAGHRE